MNSTLDGFTSRCTRPWRWACAGARAKAAPTAAVRSGLSPAWPATASRSARLPSPAQSWTSTGVAVVLDHPAGGDDVGVRAHREQHPPLAQHPLHVHRPRRHLERDLPAVGLVRGRVHDPDGAAARLGPDAVAVGDQVARWQRHATLP